MLEGDISSLMSESKSSKESADSAVLSACVIMPAHNEASRIEKVIAGVKQQGLPVLVLDDGSTDKTADVARKAGATVERHDVNQGKGAALISAFSYALQTHSSYELFITMDADGQHLPEDIPRFLDAFKRTRLSVLLGNRMAHCAKMPLLRRATNIFMSWILSRQMGQDVPDTQCGYRLFHKSVLPYLNVESTRFATESEILLVLAHHGFRMGSVPVNMVYKGAPSHIHPVRDAIRFFSMILRRRRRTKPAPHALMG